MSRGRANRTLQTIDLARRTGNYRDAEAQAAVLAMNARPTTPPAMSPPATPRTTPEAARGPTTRTNTANTTLAVNVDKAATGETTIDIDELTDEQIIFQCLYWMGFESTVDRTFIINECFSTFDDVRVLNSDAIDAMATDYGGRTLGRGKIHFGAKRSTCIKSFVHWINDFYRVSLTPTIKGLDEKLFVAELRVALSRVSTRETLANQQKITVEAASPGPLESERMWTHWEAKFVNYTRSQWGAHGVPLSYVIRENDEPDYTNEYGDFISKTISCAPLSGEFYFADRLTVFNMILSFTTGQSSHAWIKHTLTASDGRKSMKALRDHFTGEGNASRRISEADHLKGQLHYTNERAMTFEEYLTNCQKMYNIYATENEPMGDDAKVRFLFETVRHEKLQPEIIALRAQQTAGNQITYTKACNHLSMAVSRLREYIAKNRNVSYTSTGPTPQWKQPQRGTSAIYNKDGSINLGHIKEWRSLSDSDKEIVDNERKRLGFQNKRKKSYVPKSRNRFAPNSDANRMRQLQDQNNTLRRQIKAMRRNDVNPTPTQSNHDNEHSVTDAGDQFGGRNSKEVKRRKSK